MPQMASEAEMQALIAQEDNGQPRKHLVEFFTDAVLNEKRTEEEGHPCYDDREFIKKLIPGDSTCNWIGLVTETDRRKYAREYAAFKAGLEAPVDGTPLNTVPFISKGQVLELAARGIKTAEQVRDLADGMAQNIMGFHGLRRKITAYLESAQKSAPSQKLATELAKRDEEIAELKRMIEALGTDKAKK